MAGTMQPAFWQRFGNAAQIASAVVAMFALGAIYWQVQFNFKLSRENSAHEIYRAYLQMAVQYPRLAYPESAAAIAAMTREDRARYGWFVSYLAVHLRADSRGLSRRSGVATHLRGTGRLSRVACVHVGSEGRNRQLRPADAGAHPKGRGCRGRVQEGLAFDGEDHHRRHRGRRPAGVHAAAGGGSGGRRDSALLLPRAAVDRRQLPDVPRRAEGLAEAGRKLRLGRARLPARAERRAAGRQHQVADGAQGPRRRDGIPADQPSARLPDLRSGRRMRPAGPGDGLRRRFQPLSREQARGRGQVHRPAGQDDHEPLHPLHAVHPLLGRGGRRAGIGRHRPRRGHGDHDLSRAGDVVGAAGQRGRSLPGRRADLEALCLRGAAVGAVQDRNHRRDGRARLGDPRRRPRPRGHAHSAARQ